MKGRYELLPWKRRSYTRAGDRVRDVEWSRWLHIPTGTKYLLTVNVVAPSWVRVTPASMFGDDLFFVRVPAGRNPRRWATSVIRQYEAAERNAARRGTRTKREAQRAVLRAEARKRRVRKAGS